MPKPKITGACFPKLHGNQSSTGTVGGPVIAFGDLVTVLDRHNRTWTGKLGDEVADQIRLATVDPPSVVKEGPKGIEAVTVTVKNGSGDSNPVQTDSDVP
jgi:hypothetical protein